ncbi:hotdog domain-containing protein [Kitasatospora phosalacinea]|uniref:PaaI family thioesterase n=1 Tax=Kitasatospora phosalacinea TaxID=2065 RepID=UPI0035E0455C
MPNPCRTGPTPPGSTPSGSTPSGPKTAPGPAATPGPAAGPGPEPSAAAPFGTAPFGTAPRGAGRRRAAARTAPVGGSLYGRLERMDGLDAVRAARGVARALFPFSDLLGMRVVAVAPGEVLLSVTTAADHQGWPGHTHGGYLATLCDTACGLAVASLVPPRHTVVTANLSLQYLRPVPAPGGEVGCLGTVTHRQGSRVLARADVTGGDGEVLAAATALMLVRPVGPQAPDAAAPAPAPVS